MASSSHVGGTVAAVRQLLPEPADDVDVVALHARASRPRPADRPYLLLNMVASVDGATAIDGVSGTLGGDGDRQVFRALRAVPDVILVAAGTFRAEKYGSPKATERVRALRTERGQRPVPQLAVVTTSADLDVDADVFTRADEPPLVLTVDDAPAERLDRARRVAEVRTFGSGTVDLVAAVASLDVDTVLVEGGPSLNGQLAALGLVDEVNVTIAAQLVSGPSARLAHGDTDLDRRLDLAHVLEHDGDLFARYVKAR